MYHVYHSPGSRSARVLWTLEEIGAPYEVTVLDLEERRGETHRQRHPLGRVPVIELSDGRLMFESAAICLHLADEHPAANLAPLVGDPGRPMLYQWILFAMTELEPSTLAWLRVRREEADELDAMNRYRETAGALDSAVAGGWLLGDQFSVADIVVSKAAAIAYRRELTDDFDNLREYVNRAQARPAQLRADAVGRSE